DVGSSLNDVSLVEFEHEDGVGHGVLRCSHDRVDETRAALACVDEVGGESVGVRVVGVSGTLESGREKHVREPESAEVARVGGSKAYRRGDELDVEVDDHEDTNFIGATTHDTQ
ncbi:MAG: Rpp14/Pop5 family protein, partial [Halobacteria archaeon]|nr:Rpp14/Pop5 family protein [Halobacteria archaeon]